jgi:membrane-bound serine protease (ClpP class)
MAPNTSIGAASPVSMQGQEMGETEALKATNVLVAKIKGLAGNRGPKAVDWAEKAVRDAAAATEQEALDLGIIDIVAPDLPTLLNVLDGREVKVGQELVTIHSRGATQEPIDMTPIEQFLHVITDPNIAFILLTLGLNGLLFELANPGAILPGVVGGVCLLLGFYALGVLNVNYTGLGFMALAFLLFLADIKAPSHGILTVGGIVSFVLGALILFNTPYQPVSRGLVLAVALVTAAFFAFAVSAGVRAQLRRPTTGQAGMIGVTAETRSELNPEGVVFVSGELWRAVADEGKVARGQSVQIVGIDGMRLRVRQIH